MSRIFFYIITALVIIGGIFSFYDIISVNEIAASLNIESQSLQANLFLPEGYDASLTRTDNVNDFTVRLINWVLTFLAILAIAMIIYGGFLMVLSQGDETMYGKGLKILQWTIIGIIVILASYAIVNTVINFLNDEEFDFGETQDTTMSQIMQVYLQADPTEGVIIPDLNDNLTVVFTMDGSKDLTRQQLGDEQILNVQTEYFIWYGDETNNSIAANANIHPDYGWNITCPNNPTGCLSADLFNNIAVPTINPSTAFISHAYENPGTYTAQFTSVTSLKDPTTGTYVEIEKASTVQTITITNETVDYSVPAPTAGFVYEVISGGSNLVIDFWSTSFNKAGSTILDTDWITNGEDHEEFGNFLFKWDFDLSKDSNGDGDKLTDHDLLTPIACGANTCFEFPNYTIEYTPSGISGGAGSSPKYRVTFNEMPNNALRVKLRVKDMDSKREDAVVREILIPDNILSYKKPPTAFFGYKTNPGNKTIEVFNRSFAIDNEVLVSPLSNTSNTTTTFGNIEYSFAWDIDADSETHPTLVDGPYYTGSTCTAAGPTTSPAIDDGVTNNDIDSDLSGLFVEDLPNVTCPVIFTVDNYGSYDLQLTVIANDITTGEPISEDIRVIKAYLKEPEFPGPEASFIVSGVNPTTQSIQFENTSRYFDTGTDSYVDIPNNAGLPLAWDLDSDNINDITMSWDFDTLLDSDGNGKADDDENQESVCSLTGISLIDCSPLDIDTQSGGTDLFSPGRSYANHDSLPTFEVEEGSSLYSVKLTVSQKNLLTGAWYTEVIKHTVTINDEPYPLAGFTYSEDPINDTNIFFSNESKDAFSNNPFEDGTLIYWDFDINTDSDNDGNSANDKDEECAIGGNGTTCLSSVTFVDIIDTVAYEFSNYGSYKVKMTVEYENGNFDSFQQFVNVRQSSFLVDPISAFTFDITDESNHIVEFTPQSLAQNGGTLTYIWDFDTDFDTNGDGNSANDDDDPSNNSLSWPQNFQINSISGSLAEAQYSLNTSDINVELTTIETLASGQEIRNSIRRKVQFQTSTRFAPPQANFKIIPNGSIIEFLNFSTDNKGNPLSNTSVGLGYSFEWDFDLTKEPLNNPFPTHTANTDGNTSNDKDSAQFKPADYDYQQFDTYSVKLTIINPSGLSDSKVVTITLDESQTNPNIVARISANPIQGYAPLQVDFSSSGSQDKNGTISSILWNFGDNSSPAYDDTNVSHEYTTPGHYRAGLAVEGPSGKAVKYIFIDVLSSNPEIEMLLGLESPGSAQNEYQATINKPIQLRSLIVFDPTSTNLSDFNYEWEVYDGAYSTYSTSNAAHTFPELGEGFEVTLRVENIITGLVTTIVRPVKVISAPPQAFIIAQSEESTSTTVSPSYENFFADVLNVETIQHRMSFSAQDSLGAPLSGSGYTSLETFEWDFGDKTKVRLSSNISEIVKHTFTESGTFTVRLKVTDENGLINIKEKIVFIADSNRPVPKIVVTPTVGTTQTNITFDASKSFSNNGSIHEYRWIIGDSPFSILNPGIQFTGKKTQHTFETPSMFTPYDVQLTITDTSGEQSTVIIPNILTIQSQPPIAGFTVKKVDNTPNEFIFNADITTHDPGINFNDLDFTWSFGDSMSDFGSEVSHIFDEKGDYTVTLNVSDGQHDNSTSQQIKVTSNLIAKITNADPSVGKIADSGGLKINFYGEGGRNTNNGLINSTISGGSWDFGDGKIETYPLSDFGTAISHVFKSAGHHRIVFTVYDDNTQTNASTSYIVHVGSPEPKPLAVIDDSLLKEELLRTDALKNQSIEFEGFKSLNSEGLQDLNGYLLDYSWDFGDGSAINNSADPSHTFTSPGKYIVKLTVSDPSNGSVDNDKISITIKTAKPIASFTPDPTLGTSPLLINFDASSSFDPDGSIAQYVWDFGDNSTSITTSNITNHVYKNTSDRRRSHTVKLKVVDDDGEINQITRKVTVDPQL